MEYSKDELAKLAENLANKPVTVDEKITGQVVSASFAHTGVNTTTNSDSVFSTGGGGISDIIADAKPKKIKSDKYKAEFLIAIDGYKQNDDGSITTHGVLSIPRVSLNGWCYLPEELAAQHGKSVPGYIEHEEVYVENPTIRGTLVVSYDPETFALNYSATWTNQEAIDGIKSRKFKHMSMGAQWEDYDKVRGWLFPKGVQIIEGSLVEHPGIPEATVVMDSYLVDHMNGGKVIPFERCSTAFCDSLKSSLIADNAQTDSNMVDKTTKPDETPKDVKTDNVDPKQEPETTPEAKTDAKPEPKPETKTDKVEVNVDMSKIASAIEKQNKILADFAERTQEKPKPQGKVATDKVAVDAKTKFYDHVAQSLKLFQALDWNYIRGKMQADGISTDAIGVSEIGTAAGSQWLEDITVIPAGLAAGLRDTCEVVIAERGAKSVHFTLISTPAPADGTAPTVPSDVTQTISDVEATPVERILKQRVTDQAARFTAGNLGAMIAQTFRDAELLDEDTKILTELNGLTEGSLAGSFFANDATSEASTGTNDLFVHTLLAKAKRAILRKGWREARIPGRLACVMSPEQMEQLMSDTGIQRFIEWVAEGDVLKTGYIPRLHGIDLYVSTAVPTGTGNPTTVVTHRAYVYIKHTSVGLAFTKDLTIESARYPEQRATTLVATYEIAAKNKRNDSVVRITTYGSGS